jgi:hypothetical protein
MHFILSRETISPPYMIQIPHIGAVRSLNGVCPVVGVDSVGFLEHWFRSMKKDK